MKKHSKAHWLLSLPSPYAMWNVSMASQINCAGNVSSRTATLRNNIVTSCGNSLAITDVGYNLDSGNTCGFTAATSLTNTNPLLGPLQVNPPGMAIPTMAPLPGSPAINAGDDLACPPTDERGIPRPIGAHCDIGAFEFFPLVSQHYFTVIRR